MSIKKPKKIPTQDLPIYTWSPDQDGQPHIALIGDLPVIFTGATSEVAQSRADKFRADEMAKHARSVEVRKATSERMKKSKETLQ